MENLSKHKTWLENVNIILEKTNHITKDKTKPLFKKWLENLPYDIPYFDAITYLRCFSIQKRLRDDNDHLVVVSGLEGSGKSTLAIQMGAIISPQSFGTKHICYTLQDLVSVMKQQQKYDTIICDEGLMFAFSRDSSTSDNKYFVKLLSLARQLNICFIMCVPNFWTVDSYVREHRVQTLIHIRERGKFTCYYNKSIKKISIEGQRTKSYRNVRIEDNKHGGWFSKQLQIDENEYRTHKAEHMTKFLNEMSEYANTKEVSAKYMKTSVAAKILGVHIDTVKKRLKEGTLRGTKIGKLWYIDKNSVETLVSPIKSDK